MNAIDIGTALDLLGIDAAQVPKRAAGKAPRKRADKAGATPLAAVATFLLQGNYKRVEGVSTKYELQLAIDRLRDEGRIELAGGLLRLTDSRRPRREPLTREERWRREDEELRAYWERIEAHGSQSRKLDEFDLGVGSISFADAAAVEEPTPGVAAAYVLRELIPARPSAKGPACDVCPRCRATGGVRDEESLIDTICFCGGLEWVNEEVETVRQRARAKRGGKGR